MCRASSCPPTPQHFTRDQAVNWEAWLGVGPGADAEGCHVRAPVPPQLALLLRVLLVNSPQFWQHSPPRQRAWRCEGTVAASLRDGFPHGEAMALPSMSWCRLRCPLSPPISPPCRPWCKMPFLTGTALLSQNHIMRTPTRELVWVF